jgi:transposase InsO family protein
MARLVACALTLRFELVESPGFCPSCIRFERFFGTLKHALWHIQINSKVRLQQALEEFAQFYNHTRLHQNLGNRTPEIFHK